MKPLPWLALALTACQEIELAPAPPPPAPARFHHDTIDDWYLAPESIAAAEATLAAKPPGVPLARFRRVAALADLHEGHSEAAATALETLLADIESGAESATADVRLLVLRDLAVAWLRVGEQGNCIRHHGAETCLLPISEVGRHVDPRGSGKAMEVLGMLLEERPDDLEARWLFNIAAMTVGQWPDGVPGELLVPPEAFESEGEAPRFRETAVDRGLGSRQLAGGLCLDDFDGDGHLDLVTCESLGSSPLRFYRNQGDGRFEDRSLAAGLADVTGGMNLIHADVDNDGALDVLVLRTHWTPDRSDEWPVTLLLNDGQGVFATRPPVRAWRAATPRAPEPSPTTTEMGCSISSSATSRRAACLDAAGCFVGSAAPVSATRASSRGSS